MIAKLVVHGRDRTEALRVLRSALEEYKVVGVSTNVEFLRTLAGNKTFVEGHVETGFIPKHYDHLFPPLPEPSPEVLAQAALFVVLRDHPTQSPAASPWTSLVSRRFGGDVYDRTITLQTEDASAEPITIHVKSTAGGLFDVTTTTASGSAHSRRRAAHDRGLAASPGGRARICIAAYNGAPARLLRRAQDDAARPVAEVACVAWRRRARGCARCTAGADAERCGGCACRRERVEKDQPVVVLESMKTETVLRAPVAGVVKAVGCKKGEMVEEGRELVDIEEDEPTE
ncbi:Methylcrotonoyl-CoA carboxylase subunit alpha, mitochondrial [Grifola frondosa]|uniref:Methylcrotonoyl-CoA carboxylase subunit alpha, mitochondrial n=1 Tax=Grifola frondosa TaxID=5627 RepID=A0A1C7LPV1_GRIFR|nr:Methylcrotonoyl-CoA carboxylase subunit alpha, mitochondrial [Grifola frondosa]